MRYYIEQEILGVCSALSIRLTIFVFSFHDTKTAHDKKTEFKIHYILVGNQHFCLEISTFVCRSEKIFVR